MINLPKSTEFNKRIPKQKFYEKLNVTPALKRSFIDQIQTVIWRNKIAESTINIAPGKTVTEIEIFEIQLNSSELDTDVLKLIDKEIPYHIVFILSFDGKYQAWTAYKEEAASGNSAFKVDTYYHTEWLEEEKLPLKADGLDIDRVYENFVRQIAGDALKNVNDESLKESVEREKRREQLKKQIAVLETKIRKEKQFNKQVEMNGQLKRLKKELEGL